MKPSLLLPALAGAALLCGCDKQVKINSAKIELLTQNILQFEQSQAKQLAALQTQLNNLAPTLDKMNDAYFEKNHDQAFFFHTNTLYLILMVDKKIEAQLQVADGERAAQSTLAYSYYTNQMAALFLGNEQIQSALTNQASRMEEQVNAETRRVSAAASEELLTQIKRLAPEAAEIARRKELAADVAEIKSELTHIKAQLQALAPK